MCTNSEQKVSKVHNLTPAYLSTRVCLKGSSVNNKLAASPPQLHKQEVKSNRLSNSSKEPPLSNWSSWSKYRSLLFNVTLCRIFIIYTYIYKYIHTQMCINSGVVLFMMTAVMSRAVKIKRLPVWRLNDKGMEDFSWQGFCPVNSWEHTDQFWMILDEKGDQPMPEKKIFFTCKELQESLCAVLTEGILFAFSLVWLWPVY